MIPLHLPQKKVIELDHVSVAYDNRVILRDVCFDVSEGDFVAITGPNGGGKTTMLRTILRLLKPTSGRVIYRWEGKEVKRLPIGYLPQKNMIDSHFPISVGEVVASGLLSIRGLDRHERDDRVGEMVSLVGLSDYRHAPIGSLSGGQLQRALLARAIVSRPSVLVLDEPLSYVDKKFEHHIYDIVARLAGHTTILLVSHEMTAIAAMANRHLIVDRELHECHSSHHFMTSCEE
ncbi:MAG: ABC transporter ATP-binding protein [Pseudoflavonifractor sp.]|nr:ABC transporter ATP-binding protein [Pseudoflavonifractor sp.]